MKDVSVTMNWAFGFRTENTRHPLYFIEDEDQKELIIYYTAKIVVVYYP